MSGYNTEDEDDGLGRTRKSANVKYLSPYMGKLCERSKTPREGLEPRTITNEETGAVTTVYVREYEDVTGYITAIEYKVQENGKEKYYKWVVTLCYKKFKRIVEVSYDSNVAQALTKTIENIDLTRMIRWRIFPDKENPKMAVGIFYQTDDTGKENLVKMMWHKGTELSGDNPNGMPPWEYNERTKKWNSDRQKDFLHQRMELVIAELNRMYPDGVTEEYKKLNAGGATSAPEPIGFQAGATTMEVAPPATTGTVPTQRYVPPAERQKKAQETYTPGPSAAGNTTRPATENLPAEAGGTYQPGDDDDLPF